VHDYKMKIKKTKYECCSK